MYRLHRNVLVSVQVFQTKSFIKSQSFDGSSSTKVESLFF